MTDPIVVMVPDLTSAATVIVQQTQGPAGPNVGIGTPGQFFVTNPSATADEWVTVSGDVSADVVTVGKLTVTGLQGRSVLTTAPSTGQALAWNGSAWAPATIAVGPSTFTPGTAGQVLITNGTPATTWTSLISVELTHGRFTAGGTGSDYKAVIGPLTGFETSNVGLWFLATATVATSANVSVYGDASSVYLNTPNAGGKVYFVSAGSVVLGAFDWNVDRFYVGGSTATAPYIVDWATSNQTQVFSGTAATSLLIATTCASPTTIKVAGNGALTADVAPGDITLSPQQPYSSAVTNITGGNVVVDLHTVGSPIAGPFLSVRNNTVHIMDVGEYSSTGYGAIWFKQATPGGSNWSFLSDGSSTYFNAPGSNMFFGIATTYVLAITSAEFNLGATWSNPEYIFDLSATAVQHFGVSATSATIQYDQSTSGAGHAFSILGQAAKTGSAANGGALNLQPGAGDGAGNAGLVSIGTASSGGGITIGYNGGVGAGLLALAGNPVVIQSYGGGGAFEVYSANVAWDWGGTLGGFVSWDLNNLGWHNLATAPILWQYAAVSDVATVPLTIRSQYAYASATGTNRTPGSLVLDVGAPTNSGTTEASIILSRNGTNVVTHTINGTSDIFLTQLPNASWEFEWLVGSGEMLLASTTWAVGGASWWVSALGTQVGFGGGVPSSSPLFVDWTTTTTPFIQSSTSATSLALGTNKSGASTLLKGDANTTILTLSTLGEFATAVKFDNVSTPTNFASGFVSYSSSGRQAAVSANGHIFIAPG